MRNIRFSFQDAGNFSNIRVLYEVCLVQIEEDELEIVMSGKIHAFFNKQLPSLSSTK